MVKITKEQYLKEIKPSGFKCYFNVAKSGKQNKYYYLVDSDYENYLKYKEKLEKK